MLGTTSSYKRIALGRDALGRPQIMAGDDEAMAYLGNGRARLPFRDFPGSFLPRDTMRDQIIVGALKRLGTPIKRGQKLDYEQSAALFQIARDYFEHAEPLVKTERWLAEFAEKMGITYTDHDLGSYRMKNGLRRKVAAGPSFDDESDADEDEDFENTDDRMLLV